MTLCLEWRCGAKRQLDLCHHNEIINLPHLHLLNKRSILFSGGNGDDDEARMAKNDSE
jgi:hypothetical protein